MIRDDDRHWNGRRRSRSGPSTVTRRNVWGGSGELKIVLEARLIFKFFVTRTPTRFICQKVWESDICVTVPDTNIKHQFG